MTERWHRWRAVSGVLSYAERMYRRAKQSVTVTCAESKYFFL